MTTVSPVVGVALGSGGARGWAHIGVLRALLDHGIEPTVVSGTSMGALVGGVYAAGTLDLLQQFALDLDWKDVLTHFVEFKIPRSGIVEGARIVEVVRKHIAQPRFGELKHPFRAVATDLFRGSETVLAGFMEFHRAPEAIAAGYEAARKQMTALRRHAGLAS